MGKATEAAQRFARRELSTAEIAARRQEREIGDDDVTPATDGSFKKQGTVSEPSRVVFRSDTEPWD